MKEVSHRRVVDAIAGWIVGGTYPPESSLPTEPEICTRLSCSRTTVREAVKALIAKGLLTTGPRVGTHVLAAERWNLFDPDVIGWRLQAGVDGTFIRDVVELRLALEPSAGALAAERAEAADIAALDSALAAMKAGSRRGASDLEGWLAGDFAFHKAVLAATHNQFFRGVTPLIEAILRVSFRFSITSTAVMRGSLPLHRGVRDAIALHDAVQAKVRLQALIESARRDIEAAQAPKRGRARRITFKLGDAA
jgi:DNA-binding FadR family transcriptional regulator